MAVLLWKRKNLQTRRQTLQSAKPLSLSPLDPRHSLSLKQTLTQCILFQECIYVKEYTDICFSLSLDTMVCFDLKLRRTFFILLAFTLRYFSFLL